MTREIPLSQGKIALVDDADYEWLSQWKWCYTRTSEGCEYAVRTVKRDGRKLKVLMHRAIAVSILPTLNLLPVKKTITGKHSRKHTANMDTPSQVKI